jgi:hypothetical protein
MSLENLEGLLGESFATSRFVPTRDPDIDWSDESDTSFAERRRRAHDVLARRVGQANPDAAMVSPVDSSHDSLEESLED